MSEIVITEGFTPQTHIVINTVQTLETNPRQRVRTATVTTNTAVKNVLLVRLMFTEVVEKVEEFVGFESGFVFCSVAG